jgi:hypothetical protein
VQRNSSSLKIDDGREAFWPNRSSYGVESADLWVQALQPIVANETYSFRFG